jgi:isoquinoline 1-oxidoreductase beta subunit
MGQGTLTGLAQLVAEELECDWSKVTTEGVSPGRNLASKRAWGEMGTGGSRGIRTSQDYVRRGGAAARIMLLQAAADQWKVPVAELTVSKGVITHAASKRKTSYGKVAAAASKVTPPDPKAITLKGPEGLEHRRQAAEAARHRDKLNGSKIYAIDVKLPDMLCAAIKDCPVFGGKVTSFDESKIAGMPGVKKVVKVKDTGVAVVADTWWRAKKALDALPIVWDEAGNGNVSSASIAEQLKEGPLVGNDQRRAQRRRCAKGDRRGGEEGRGGLLDAVPCPRLHGDDERHREAHGRQGRVLGADAES